MHHACVISFPHQKSWGILVDTPDRPDPALEPVEPDRVLAVLALLLTGGAVTVAFLTGAAAQPWVRRGAVLGWVVLLAAHAAFLASRREPGARQRGPVVAGVGRGRRAAVGGVRRLRGGRPGRLRRPGRPPVGDAAPAGRHVLLHDRDTGLVEQVSGSFASKPGWEQWQCVYTSPT
jgi:hypothetical protein